MAHRVRKGGSEVERSRKWMFSIAILLLANGSVAQDGLTIQTKSSQPQLEEEARAIYVAACAAVQQEFRQNRPLIPKVTLVLGATEDGVVRETGEIRLRTWNRYLFAQGVVILALGELLPSEEKVAMAKRAVSWADATISAQQLQR